MQEQIRFDRCQCICMTLREKNDIAPVRPELLRMD
jgi:hypothetical protein